MEKLSLEMRALASNLQSFSDCYSYTALETIFNLSRFPSGYASNVSLCQYHRYTHNNMFLCIYLPPTFATPFLSNFTKDDFLMILTKTLFNICLEDINTRTFEWSVCSRDVVKQNNKHRAFRATSRRGKLCGDPHDPLRGLLSVLLYRVH